MSIKRQQIVDYLLDVCNQTIRIEIGTSQTKKKLSELGATSLKLMQLISYVYETYETIIEPEEIQSNNTIELLAGLIDLKLNHADDRASRTDHPSEYVLPLNQYQLHLWNSKHSHSFLNTQNELRVRTLKGKIDTNDFLDAVLGVVERYPILFSSIRSAEQPLIAFASAIEKSVALSCFEFMDHSTAPDGLNQTENKIREMAEAGFDLSKSLGIKILLSKIDDNEFLFCLYGNKMLLDNRSLAFIEDELYFAYAKLRNPSVEIIKHADYLAPSLPTACEDKSDEVNSYWQNTLKAPGFSFDLSDSPRPPIKSYKGGLVKRQLDPDKTKGFEDLINENGLWNMGVCAFVLTLVKMSSKSLITVSIPHRVTDSNDNETFQLGMFENILPLLFDVNFSSTLESLTRLTKRKITESKAHGSKSINHVVKELGIPVKLNRSAISEYTFRVYENTQDPEQLVDEISHSEQIMLSRGTSDLDLTVYLVKSGERYCCYAEYASSVLNQSQVETFLQKYELIFGECLSNPKLTISELMCQEMSQSEPSSSKNDLRNTAEVV
jgi:acyl carrier protein